MPRYSTTSNIASPQSCATADLLQLTFWKKRIRHFIDEAQSSPNVTDKTYRINWIHTGKPSSKRKENKSMSLRHELSWFPPITPDHCLEILRQGAMCRGDISLVTFYWEPSTLLPRADFSAPHECVNFDRINQWSGNHAVDALEPGMLHHPVLGKWALSVFAEQWNNMFQVIFSLRKIVQWIEWGLTKMLETVLGLDQV